MIALSDPPPGAWTPMTVRGPAGALGVWDHRLSPCDQSVPRMAQAAGRIVTAQRRREIDGAFELLAARFPAPGLPTLAHRGAGAWP